MSTLPPTHTVEIRREADGHRVALFTSHDADDAARYVRAVVGAHPGWVGAIEPLPANPIADALREVA